MKKFIALAPTLTLAPTAFASIAKATAVFGILPMRQSTRQTALASFVPCGSPHFLQYLQ